MAQRANGGDGGHDLAELELVEDGGLTGSVETLHTQGRNRQSSLSIFDCRGRDSLAAARRRKAAARRGSTTERPPKSGPHEAAPPGRSRSVPLQPRQSRRSRARTTMRMRISFLENSFANSLRRAQSCDHSK